MGDSKPTIRKFMLLGIMTASIFVGDEDNYRKHATSDVRQTQADRITCTALPYVSTNMIVGVGVRATVPHSTEAWGVARFYSASE